MSYHNFFLYIKLWQITVAHITKALHKRIEDFKLLRFKFFI